MCSGRKILTLWAPVVCFLTFSSAFDIRAQTATTGTVRTLPFLLGSEFQDGQAPGSITAQDMRDLIVSLGQGNIGIEIDYFQSGVPAASTRLVKSFSRSTVVPTSPAIRCNAIVGATSSTTLTLSANISNVASNVGTLVFAASGPANAGCTVTFSSPVTFAGGDFLTVVFPSTPDATLANISISVPGVQ